MLMAKQGGSMVRDTTIAARGLERTVIKAFRKRGREATIPDIVAATAMSIRDAETTVKRMLDTYRGHLRVTESGELLYYFPEGFRDRRRGIAARLGRALRFTGRLVARGSAVLFKAWIVVMLVGYFALFIALLVAAVVASVAVSVAGRGEGSRSRSRGGGFGMLYLTSRLIRSFFYLWMYSSASSAKRRQRGRPLHTSVFAYVFGEGDPNAGWEERARLAVIAFIRRHKGIITGYEASVITGLSQGRSQELLNRMLSEYDGSPEVSDEGALYYRFPTLMISADSVTNSYAGDPSAPERQIVPFNANTRSMNRWITLFNGVNVVFGGYFLFTSLVPAPTYPDGTYGLYTFSLFVRELLSFAPNTGNIVMIGLGIIPLAFSALFFAVPLIRRIRDARKNRANRSHNYRRRIVGAIVDRPLGLNVDSLLPERAAHPKDIEVVRRETIAEFLADGEVEVRVDEHGETLYDFVDLDRGEREVARVRELIDSSTYDTGKVIFDSGTDPVRP
jgi:hypothetical protein